MAMGRLATKAVVDGVISGVMLLASVAVLFFVWQNTNTKPRDPGIGPVPSAPVSLVGSALEGDPEAGTAVIVFSDFECPFCRGFAQSLWPTFRDEYVSTGKVLVSFRHLPLKIHPSARPAAQAATCAGEQGKFWLAHDTFFAEPSSLRNIDRAIADIGADMAAFASCKSSERTSAAIESDLALAKALEIGATPTFLVGANDGGKSVRVTARFSGALDYAKFKNQMGFGQDVPGR
jgi:protein-disulfide isomerase